MSRIAPIRRSHALVRAARRPEPPVGERAPERPAERVRVRRPATAPRPALGDAAAEAAFEVHRLIASAPRGLRADTGVRRQWSEAYARAAAPAPAPIFDLGRA